MKLTWPMIAVAVVALLAATHLPQSTPAAAATLCNEIFQPVCARTKAGTVQTFSNACFAKVAGARVVSQGACPIFCPDLYMPVCGRIDGVNKTYANACFAMVAGAVVLDQGVCPGKICTQLWMPVCAVTPSGTLKTFTNRCWAINSGSRILHAGKC